MPELPPPLILDNADGGRGEVVVEQGEEGANTSMTVVEVFEATGATGTAHDRRSLMHGNEGRRKLLELRGVSVWAKKGRVVVLDSLLVLLPSDDRRLGGGLSGEDTVRVRPTVRCTAGLLGCARAEPVVGERGRERKLTNDCILSGLRLDLLIGDLGMRGNGKPDREADPEEVEPPDPGSTGVWSRRTSNDADEETASASRSNDRAADVLR